MPNLVLKVGVEINTTWSELFTRDVCTVKFRAIDDLDEMSTFNKTWTNVVHFKRLKFYTEITITDV